ncbi:MAG: Radical SAM superfamily protein [Syntrophaceae bacterium PtaU1.Bin231]|nr:MAG: Radical SAM superfamily protein [Syntrophaceae bacterium PtaU1.Bin231]
MHGHDDDFISGADESSMVTGVRPRRPGTSPDPSHLTPLQTYLVKTGKDHYFTYRPDEYYQNPSDYDLKAVLCSITEVSGSLHFSFSADILDREIRRDPRVLLDRAVLWPSDMVEKFKVNKGIYTNINVRDFDIILISAFMIHQVMNVVPFLLQCRINPLKESRPQLVVMGGNCSLLYRYLKPFIDLFYFGDGEPHIRRLLQLRRENRDKRDFVRAVMESEMADCVTDGRVKEIRPAVQKDIGPSILCANDFISKPVNNVLETQRGCKYNCYFCFLTAYKSPYRINKIETLRKAIETYPPGRVLYPFAPDESSYPYKQELRDAVSAQGCRTYMYNKRFDTFNPEPDLQFAEASSRIVFGLDGLSQRIREFNNKQITMDQIWRGMKAVCDNHKIAKVKVNLVFAFDGETEEDYREFEQLFAEVSEYRKKVRPAFDRTPREIFDTILVHKQKIEAPLIFLFGPTPHVPMPGTPFEFMASAFRKWHADRLKRAISWLQNTYAFFTFEGLNAEDSHNSQVMLWRAGEELIPVLLAWHRTVGMKPFSSSDNRVFLRFARNMGLNYEAYLGEISQSKYPEIKFKIPEGKRRTLFLEAKERLHETKAA